MKRKDIGFIPNFTGGGLLYVTNHAPVSLEKEEVDQLRAAGEDEVLTLVQKFLKKKPAY